MVARVTTVQGDAANIDEVVKTIREQVVPIAARMSGFRGILTLVDRASGKAISVTLWSDADAMQRSEAFADEQRRASAAAGSTVLSVVVLQAPANEMPAPNPSRRFGGRGARRNRDRI